MAKQRIIFKDRDGSLASTSCYVCWSYNAIYQRRQFATDGVRFFYQPSKQEAFIQVSESDLPDMAREALDDAFTQ